MNIDSTANNIYRYLSSTPKDRAWGCYLTATGSHDVSPGHFAFADPSGHHLWKKRRTLKDYGIIYLAKGQGVFASHDTGEITITAGDAIILFPDVWHRYRPDPRTGWSEYWLLFNGQQPDRLLEHKILSPRYPIFHVGVDNRVEELFSELVETAQAQPSVPIRIMSALSGLILAHTISAAPDQSEGESRPEQDVLRAQWYLEERVHEDFNMEELAASLKLSVSTLNRHFRHSAGQTPHQYHLQLRIDRAKELLEEPEMMVKQIARNLGFHDQYYFSRIFKKHTGYSPLEWRKTVSRGIG